MHVKSKAAGAILSAPERLVTERKQTRGTTGRSVIVSLVRLILATAEKCFFFGVLHSEFSGREHIPEDAQFIVAANHSSHADMGLAALALGERGGDLAVLAAADYFFDGRFKRAFFSNFTNLIPMKRKGPLRESLKCAFELAEQGRSLLLFPEGTRTRTGQLQGFQRGLGHLALRARIGVLPMYLNTFQALPPGSWFLKARRVSATIGPFLPPQLLQRAGDGLPRCDAERAVTRLVARVVADLRDNREPQIDEAVETIRRELQAARHPARAVPSADGGLRS